MAQVSLLVWTYHPFSLYPKSFWEALSLPLQYTSILIKILPESSPPSSKDAAPEASALFDSVC